MPLRVHVTLTSNPKGMGGYPEEAKLDASLEAEVDTNGKFAVLKFDLQS